MGLLAMFLLGFIVGGVYMVNQINDKYVLKSKVALVDPTVMEKIKQAEEKK